MKKLLATLLAMAMLLSMVTVASAETAADDPYFGRFDETVTIRVVEAEADEHRRRDRDGRAEAGHALQEVPEAPDDEERENARIARNAGEARADRPHRARFDRERIDEERGEDDEADRVEREADAVGHHRRDLRGRQVVPEEGERQREREKGRTERGPVGLDLEERERGRQEGDRQEGEREKGDVHVFSGRGVSPGGGR